MKMKNFVENNQTQRKNRRRTSKRKEKVLRFLEDSDYVKEARKQCKEILKIFVNEEKKKFVIFIGKDLRYICISSIYLF